MVQTRAIIAASALRGLYAITDSALMPGEQLFAKAEAALRGGCRVLQYRNKTATPEQQQHEASRLCQLCRKHGALFIVNDDVDLALAIEADGIHIGQTDTALPAIRARVGERMIVGVSCHGALELAKQAEQQGASYVAFGRFFDSHTKPQAPPAGLDIVRQAKALLALPLVAIGGITRDNAPRVIAQGADMIAVIHDLFSPENPREVEHRAKTFSQFFS